MGESRELARADLLENLAALKRVVGETSVLRQILDEEWFVEVEADIRQSPAGHPTTTDPSGVLYDFCHPLRGVEWFEADQQLLLAGRVNEIGEDGKTALFFAGVDPLVTILPKIEERLVAFEAQAATHSIVRSKLSQLKGTRSNPAFKNHLFEAAVVGDLADRGVLVDVEDGRTAVDAVMNIDGRDILVEATNTIQQVVPHFVGVFSSDPRREINQVVEKVRKKVAHGRQLALADGKPTLLFIARTRLGAGREAASIALNECFRAPEFAGLSGVVLADSWKFYATSWHSGSSPDVPFSKVEMEALAHWYGS